MNNFEIQLRIAFEKELRQRSKEVVTKELRDCFLNSAREERLKINQLAGLYDSDK